MIFRVCVGLIFMAGGGLAFLSAYNRARLGGPTPLFLSGRGVRRGYRRAERTFYLAGFLMGLASLVLTFSKPRSPSEIVFLVVGLTWMLCLVVFVLQVAFNRPKWWIDPRMRDDEGALVTWWHQKTGKTPRQTPREAVAVAPTAPTAPVEQAPASVVQHVPEGSTGSVTIHRRREVYGMAAWYRVLVDGKPAGRLRVGKELTLELPAGEHMFQAKSGPSSSAVLRQFVAPDATLRIEVSHTPLGEDETLVDRALANRDILRLTVESA